MTVDIKQRMFAAILWTCPDCGGELVWRPAKEWCPVYGERSRARWCPSTDCTGFTCDLDERSDLPARTQYNGWYIEGTFPRSADTTQFLINPSKMDEWNREMRS